MLAAVLCVLPVVAMASPVLDRDLTHYTILGLRRVRLKNFAMEPPGCHVGVNCGQPDANSPCGQLNAKHAQFASARLFARVDQRAQRELNVFKAYLPHA